jgi:hypothetical protein
VDPVDRQYLTVWNGSLAPASGVLAGLAFDPIGSVADCEVSALFSVGTPAVADSIPLLFLRAGGTSSTEDAAIILCSPSADQVQVFVQIWEGGEGENSLGPINLAIPSRHPFWVRARLTGPPGEALFSVKVWALGDPEPGAWDDEDVPIEGGNSVLAAGQLAVGCAPAEDDLRTHSISISTDADENLPHPETARESLEAGRPSFLARCDVFDSAGDQVELWFSQEGKFLETESLDHPASTSMRSMLSESFAIDQGLELDSWEALVPQRLRSLRLRDYPVGAGTGNAPAPRLDRGELLSYTWSGGLITLYALPAGALSSRERVAIASGSPSKDSDQGRPSGEPIIDGEYIQIDLNPTLETIGGKEILARRHSGPPIGWRRLSGNQMVEAPHSAAYDITSYTLIARFRTPAFDVGAGAISRLFRRVGTTNQIWTEILAISAGRLQWRIGNGATTQALISTPASLDLADDEPHVLACSIDADRAWWLAIDGVVLGSGAPTIIPATPAAVTWLAYNIDGFWCDGRILNGYLEPEQALPLAETAPEADDSDLSVLGYWRGDDGAGTTVTDYSPLGNHATATGTKDTNFAWVPTDLGMVEQGGRVMPVAHGQLAHAPAERIDPQNLRYRITDRDIVNPASPIIDLKERGSSLGTIGIAYTDQGGGVLAKAGATEALEPVTWSQGAEVPYEDLLAELLEVRAGIISSGLSRGSISMIGRVLPDSAGWAAAAGGGTTKRVEMLSSVLSGTGAHIRQTPDGIAIVGYWLPPVSPGPDGESPALEWAGVPRAVHLPPPGSTLSSSYTICCWVKSYSGYGSPRNVLGTSASELLPDSVLMAHYRPGSSDRLFVLGTEGRARSSLVVGDTVSSSPKFLVARGAFRLGEWMFVAAVMDSSGATRQLYRMFQGGSAVELLATGAYSGVASGDRPGDGYTALGAYPGGEHALVGSMGHIGMWDGVLSESDLTAVATGTPLDRPTGLLYYVPATEGGGDFLRDAVAGHSALIQGQRWAPRAIYDLFEMSETAVLLPERRLRPAKSIRVSYRPNYQPLEGGDVLASLTAAERQALKKPWREVSWFGGPDSGVEIAVETPFYHSTGAQRVLELIRIRRAEGRYLRPVRLYEQGKSLLLDEEVRLDNIILPTGLPGSWTGRIASISDRAYERTLGLGG